jgi:DNA-binding NarL/FixJ family response regulator
LVVSDVRVYREGLLQLLSRYTDIDPLESPARGDAVASYARHLRADVVMVDMTSDDARSTVRAVAEKVGDVRVIALAASGSKEEILEWKKLGVAAHVSREASLEELHAAIRTVARGESGHPAPGQEIRRGVSSAAQQSDPKSGARLTRREAEVLDLIDRGFSNDEIAQRLRIAVATVKNHVHSVLLKLGVRRRGQAVYVLRGRDRTDDRGDARG